MPDYDAKLEALVPVVAGELPAHFHAHRADDIATAVRLSREFGLKLVVVHGTEGYLVPELLAEAGVPVITGPASPTAPSRSWWARPWTTRPCSTGRG